MVDLTRDLEGYLRARSSEITWAWATLAIARWLKTGELQASLFANTIDLGYVEQQWRMDAVDRIVMRMCAAERFADVIALFDRPQLAPYRELAPDRAALLGYAFAQHMVTKRFSSDVLEDAAERTLDRAAKTLVERHHMQALAELVYVTSMQLAGGTDARAAFARYVRT